MAWWAYGLWGAFGGMALEAWEIRRSIRQHGCRPWGRSGELSGLLLLACVAIRVAVGTGVAVAAGSTGQIVGPLGAIAAGITGPLLLEQMGQEIPSAPQVQLSHTSSARVFGSQTVPRNTGADSMGIRPR
jgi:hypothetical protein